MTNGSLIPSVLIAQVAKPISGIVDIVSFDYPEFDRRADAILQSHKYAGNRLTSA